MALPFRTLEPSSPHTHTVVFLHGRGDNADNFAVSLRASRTSDGQSLYQAFPSFRWVFPQAPTRQCVSSPAIWPQWFDVWNVGDFAEREMLQAEGLREVVSALKDLLAKEAATLGGRWDRVVLAGISMGGATMAHLLFQLDIPGPRPRLGAALGFSCRCPFSGRSLTGMRAALGLEGAPPHDSVIRNTPVLLEHCADDPLVLVANGMAMRDTLAGFGAHVEWKKYPNGGHWFHAPQGMDDVVAFVQRHVLGSEGGLDESKSNGSNSAAEAMDLS